MRKSVAVWLWLREYGSVNERASRHATPSATIDAPCAWSSVAFGDIFGNPPPASRRLARRRTRARSHISAAIDAAEDFPSACFIDGKAVAGSLVEHPFQRDLGQAALGLGITASDIAV